MGRRTDHMPLSGPRPDPAQTHLVLMHEVAIYRSRLAIDLVTEVCSLVLQGILPCPLVNTLQPTPA